MFKPGGIAPWMDHTATRGPHIQAAKRKGPRCANQNSKEFQTRRLEAQRVCASKQKKETWHAWDLSLTWSNANAWLWEFSTKHSERLERRLANKRAPHWHVVNRSHECLHKCTCQQCQSTWQGTTTHKFGTSRCRRLGQLTNMRSWRRAPNDIK